MTAILEKNTAEEIDYSDSKVLFPKPSHCRGSVERPQRPLEHETIKLVRKPPFSGRVNLKSLQFQFSPVVFLFRLLHVWGGSDGGVLQPLLRHLCGHRGQRRGSGRRPEPQPVCEDPHRGDLRQRHRPVRRHRSHPAGDSPGF